MSEERPPIKRKLLFGLAPIILQGRLGCRPPRGPLPDAWPDLASPWQRKASRCRPGTKSHPSRAERRRRRKAERQRRVRVAA